MKFLKTRKDILTQFKKKKVKPWNANKNALDVSEKGKYNLHTFYLQTLEGNNKHRKMTGSQWAKCDFSSLWLLGIYIIVLPHPFLYF